jgi:hypothetical protein
MHAETAHINVSTVAFRLAAQDYFKCYLDFKKPRAFSVVPFFLCCRAIELALKSMHLETKDQNEVKASYSHNLMKLYSDLPQGKLILSKEESELLKEANKIYKSKHFEYLYVQDMAEGFNRFPDLESLATLARKITAYDK